MLIQASKVCFIYRKTHSKSCYVMKFSVGDLKLLGIRLSNKCCDSSQGPFSGIINPEATERISLFTNDIDITFFFLQGVS